MSDRALLTEDELDEAVAGLDGWTVSEGKLHRDLAFGDFVSAFAFMTAAAFFAERMNHHPEWSNVYNRVSIDLSTHDAGGITALDVRLAAEIDRLVGETGRR